MSCPQLPPTCTTARRSTCCSRAALRVGKHAEELPGHEAWYAAAEGPPLKPGAAAVGWWACWAGGWPAAWGPMSGASWTCCAALQAALGAGAREGGGGGARGACDDCGALWWILWRMVPRPAQAPALCCCHAGARGLLQQLEARPLLAAGPMAACPAGSARLQPQTLAGPAGGLAAHAGAMLRGLPALPGLC